jgi:hypothetical protein
MTDAYQSLNAGGDIGALLRLIQEEKANSILAAPPATETGSPIREVVSDPIVSPESPGSTRVASLRPEGAVTSTDAVGQSQGLGLGQVVGPVAPVAPAPVAPSAPGNPSSPSSPSAPQASPIAQLARSLPNIGTAIKAAAAKAPTSQYNTPTRSTRGGIISKPLVTPTPTPPSKQTLQNATRGKTTPSIGNAWRA